MGAVTIRIRPPVRAELPRLRTIEVAAGQVFADVGMHRIASDGAPSLDELATQLAAGELWIAAFQEPVAYLRAEPVDGDLHIAQVSVHPEHARRGIGAALIEHATRLAARTGLPALSLTTFRDVPWNGPYYRRLGFTELTDADLGPGLAAIRAKEIAAGLDDWPRCAMRRPLGAPSFVAMP